MLISNDHNSDIGNRWDIEEIVSDLRRSRDITHVIPRSGSRLLPPSRAAFEAIVAGLLQVLFPHHFGEFDLDKKPIDNCVGGALRAALDTLLEQTLRCSLFVSDDSPSGRAAQDAARITQEFALLLPDVRGLLVTDCRAALAGDPAATCLPEILTCYPGILAIMHYRVARALHKLGAPLAARMISDIAHCKTGVDIHPGADIGQSFFIDHGTGVVIGETTVIGERVRIYQAVTLGARHFPTDEEGNIVKGAPRHPIVEDDVVIYAGATILGRIVVGKGAVIGGNVWLTKGVPPNSLVTQDRVAMLNRKCIRFDECQGELAGRERGELQNS